MKLRPVLLLDDSEDLREVFSTWLEMEDYSTVAAKSGDEALDMIRGGLTPCMILVDLNMPGMRGTEFIKQVRSLGLIDDTPIYIFSASPNVARVEGTNGWIKKPVDMDELLEILKAIHPPCSPAQAAGDAG